MLAGCKLALFVLCVSLSGSPRVQSRTPGSLYHGRLYVVIERRPCRPAGAQVRRVLFAYVYCENQTPWQGEEIFLWSQTPPLPPPHTAIEASLRLSLHTMSLLGGRGPALRPRCGQASRAVHGEGRSLLAHVEQSGEGRSSLH